MLPAEVIELVADKVGTTRVLLLVLKYAEVPESLYKVAVVSVLPSATVRTKALLPAASATTLTSVALAAFPVHEPAVVAEAELPVMLIPQVPDASPPVRVGTLSEALNPVALFLRM
jgi:hypothetical protein